MLAARAARIAQSPTMKVAGEALKLKAEGVDVVDFGAGEPDFPTPPHIGAAAHAAIDGNFTKYTANSGTDELKRAIAARYLADYGVEYATSDIIVSAGGKQALYNATLVLFGEGDEVLTHSPGWPTLVEQIRLADATPVLVQTHADERFRLSAAPFIAAFTPRTRGVIITSPGNPTGALMPESELALLADEAARRNIWILLDLCYEKLIYEPTPHNLPGVLAATIPSRSIVCGSASKAYAMTGWRCGWAIGPTRVIAACNALQSHATSNVCSITQKAVTAALTGSQECVAAMLAEYRQRRDQLCRWLSAEPRLHFVTPEGAFYLLVDVSAFLSPDGIRTSAQLAQSLLDEARVAVTPGEAFDAPGFVRISFATSLSELERGTARLIDYLRATADRPGAVAG
jgi:aspartate aminotransferase